MAEISTGRTHSFGYWVRRRRKALDLTQRELAENASCSLSAIKKIEAETRRPSQQLAEILADCLAIPEIERERFLRSARGLEPVDGMPLASQPLAPAAEESDRQRPWTAGNLPLAVGPIFGRDEELDRLSDLVSADDNRLITLAGPGGVGKSRLSLEAVRQVQGLFRDGAWFVPLAGVYDPAYLSTAIAVALGVNFAGPLDPEQQLIRHLQGRQLLLLLDNFEQLLPEGAELVSTLIYSLPEITVLVTSRERLRLQAEVTVSMNGLGLEPAKALFANRAQRAGAPDQVVDPTGSIDRICRLVGGLPLALEMAAAWARLLPSAEILTALQQSADLLTGDLQDVPDRHRSMRAVFDASWDRLSRDEQKLLAGLSVFAGSFSRDAAERICGATLPQLAVLHDHSLLQRDKERFHLHELIRQFAAGRLAGLPDRAAVRERHAVYYADFLAHLSDLFKSGGSQLVDWDRTVDRETDNIRVAWRWFIESEQPQRLLPSILALYLYQDFRGQVREGAQMAAALRECAARLLAEAPADEDLLRRTKAMTVMGQAAMGIRAGEVTRGREQLEEAYALLNGLEAPDERVALIGLLGPVAMMTMGGDSGQRAIEQTLALAEREGHAWGRALALNFLGLFHLSQGRMAKAKDTLIEAVDLWGEQPGLAWCRERSMVHLGLTHHALGEYETALSVQEEALELARQVRDHSFAPLSQCNLAFHHYARGELAPAREAFRAGLAEAQRFGLLNSVAHSILGLGLVAAAQGLAADAVTLLAFGFDLPRSYLGFLLGEPQRVLAELRAELPPADFAAAESQAREIDLAELINSGLLRSKEGN